MNCTVETAIDATGACAVRTYSFLLVHWHFQPLAKKTAPLRLEQLGLRSRGARVGTKSLDLKNGLVKYVTDLAILRSVHGRVFRGHAA